MDTRFSYCALCALWLLDRLDAIDVPAATAYVAACKNFDGGFGCTPGGLVGWGPGHGPVGGLRDCKLEQHCFALLVSRNVVLPTASLLRIPVHFGAPHTGNESHAGQVFTCVAALAIAGRLDLADRDLLCWW